MCRTFGVFVCVCNLHSNHILKLCLMLIDKRLNDERLMMCCVATNRFSELASFLKPLLLHANIRQTTPH